MTGRLLAIAMSTFRENRRDRVLYVLLFFAGALILAGTAFGELSPFEQAKLLLDLGQASIFLGGSLIALFLGNGLISREIERRTIYVILSKPVGRGEFLVGKILGLSLTLSIALFVMAGLLTAVVFFYGAPPTLALLQSFVLLWIESVLLVSLAAAFACFVSSGTLAGMLSVSCWILGQVLTDLDRLAQSSERVFARGALRIAYWVLPNLSLFDARSRASYGVPLSAGELLGVLTYGIAYSVMLIAFAMIALSRRDFR